MNKYLRSKEIIWSILNNEKNLIITLQIFFIISRFIFYKNPINTYDYGNHLMIAKYLVQGRMPYKEFSIVHMPGLYIPLSLGFLISDSIFFPLFFYVFITSFSIPLYYYFLKKFFTSKIIIYLGIFLFLTDPLLTLYSKSITIDCFGLPFIIAFLTFLFEDRLSNKDYLIFSGLSFIIFFIKIPAIYFSAFAIFFYLLFFSSDKTKFKKTIILGIIFFLIIGTAFLILNRIYPVIFKDVFSHLIRPRMPIRKRLEQWFSASFWSPLGILSAFIISSLVMLFSREKKLRFFSFFFLFYILFSVFVPQNFYRHHLIFVIPLGIIVIISLVNDSLTILKREKKNFLFFIFLPVFIVLLFSFNYLLWLFTLFARNSGTAGLYQKTALFNGRLYSANNFYYFVTKKEPEYWYFATITDGPCRWGNSCYMHRELLTRADFAILDWCTWGHVTDPEFYEYLNNNFILDFYDPKSEVQLYLRR